MSERQVQAHGKSIIYDGKFTDARTTTLFGKYENFEFQFIFW